LGKAFTTQHISTIGADFSTLSKNIGEIPVQFQIWDVAGQDIFENVRLLYYKGALGALMVYDVTDISSLEALLTWVEELEKGSGRGIVPFMILGNKIDLLDDTELLEAKNQVRKILTKLNRKYASKGFHIEYCETSAKTGENVQKAFESLGNKIIDFVEHRKSMRGN